MLDVVHTQFPGEDGTQLTVNFGTAETVTLDTALDIEINSMPTGLVRFRNGGSADGIAAPRMNPGGIDIVLGDGQGANDFDISEIDGAYDSAVTQVFATDLDGDQVEDLISDGEGGDIVIALSSGD